MRAISGCVVFGGIILLLGMVATAAVPKGVTKVSHVHFYNHDHEGECHGKSESDSESRAHGHCEAGEMYSCRDNRWCFTEVNSCERPAEGGRSRDTILCGQCEHQQKIIDCDTPHPKRVSCDDTDCEVNCVVTEAPQAGCDKDDDMLYEYHQCQAVVHEIFGDVECTELLSREWHPAGHTTCLHSSQFQCIVDPNFGPSEAEAEGLRMHKEAVQRQKELEESV